MASDSLLRHPCEPFVAPQSTRSFDRRAPYEEKGRKQSTLLVGLALAGFGAMLSRELWHDGDLTMPVWFLLAATAGISSMAVP
jgi:hypothetical protein